MVRVSEQPLAIRVRCCCAAGRTCMLHCWGGWLAQGGGTERGPETLNPGAGWGRLQGTEKVCLIQEQLSNNRIIVELDSKGQARAPPRSPSCSCSAALCAALTFAW